MNDMEKGMKRGEYWLWGFGFMAAFFVIGVMTSIWFPECQYDDNCAAAQSLDGLAMFVGVIFSVFTGYRRTVDIGCSRWWTIAALLLIGWIILGLIPSAKPKQKAVEDEFENMQRELDRWP